MRPGYSNTLEFMDNNGLNESAVDCGLYTRYADSVHSISYGGFRVLGTKCEGDEYVHVHREKVKREVWIEV